MDYLVLAFVSKFAVEVAFFLAKACFKRYKATKKRTIPKIIIRRAINFN